MTNQSQKTRGPALNQLEASRSFSTAAKGDVSLVLCQHGHMFFFQKQGGVESRGSMPSHQEVQRPPSLQKDPSRIPKGLYAPPMFHEVLCALNSRNGWGLWRCARPPSAWLHPAGGSQSRRVWSTGNPSPCGIRWSNWALRPT